MSMTYLDCAEAQYEDGRRERVCAGCPAEDCAECAAGGGGREDETEDADGEAGGDGK